MVQPPSEPRDSNPVPFERPPAARSFVGRVQACDALVQALLVAEPRCAVSGPAGIGKTALAAEAIARVVGSRGERLAASPFPDGVIFLDARACPRTDAIWTALANALDARTLTQSSPPRAIAERAAAGRRALVVVEGAEAVEDPDELSSVLDAGSTALLLTRANDRIDAPRCIRIEAGLGASEAVELLRAFAPELPDDELQASCEALGGHPYALALAGEQLARSGASPTAFLRALRDAKLPAPEAADRSRLLLAWLFERDLRGVDADARALLRTLARLAFAPVSLSLARAALRSKEEARARDAIAELERGGWLRRLPGTVEAWQMRDARAHEFVAELACTDPGAIGRARSAAVEALRDAARVAASPNGIRRLRIALAHALSAACRSAAHDEEDELVEALVHDARRQLFEAGRSWEARACAEAAAEALDAIAPERRGHAWKRERAAACFALGHVALAWDELGAARASYEASRELMSALVASDPSNTDWTRDLALVLSGLASVAIPEGNGPEALALLEQSREIEVELLAAQPADATRRRDLHVTLTRLSRIQLALGDAANALDSAREAERIARELVAEEPADDARRDDLAFGLERRAEAERALGEQLAARRALEECIALRRELAAAHPANASHRRDLGVVLDLLGDVQLALDDPDAALASFEAGLELARALAESDPSNPKYQRDLGVSFEQVGDAFFAQGDAPNARAAFEASRGPREALVAAQPANGQWARDLWITHLRLARVADSIGDAAAVRAELERALEVAEAPAPPAAGWPNWSEELEWNRSELEKL